MLCDLSAPVIFFPVRHHSPAAARLVRNLCRELKPRSILIEGPADYNDRLHELFLPHRLPLAIYSYVRLGGKANPLTPNPSPQRGEGSFGRGAYYPLCEHSPEWQALLAGRELGAQVRFIDLPWADLAVQRDVTANRYADAEFTRSRYVPQLCRKLGVDDFNTLWDTLFELDPTLTVEGYLERCHLLCGPMRLLDGPGSLVDRQREAFMAAQVRASLAERGGPVVVVTGGYHSIALHARLASRERQRPEFLGLVEPDAHVPRPPEEGEERGLALTPYSFERLDALMGYEAGMPNPGFYHQLWQDRQADPQEGVPGEVGERRGVSPPVLLRPLPAGLRRAARQLPQGHPPQETFRVLLEQITARLRQRNQAISSADLIAAETTARGLAALRGHPLVWRTDLVDGLTAALIKEELATAGTHPLLEVIHEVLRGGERGLLAQGTLLPPLVQDIQEQLTRHDLQVPAGSRDLYLDLDEAEARPRSRVLHRLRLLDVSGCERTAGTDLSTRDDLSRVWERWRLSWSPDFDARCIEAARYGPTLAEAASARLTEHLGQQERDAAAAALLLLDAALAGLTEQAAEFLDRLQERIRGDGDFFSVVRALAHLLYLYRYDLVLETAGLPSIGGLLAETFNRSLWLLESLGKVSGRDKELIEGVRTLCEVFDRCAASLGLNREELLAILGRAADDMAQTPQLRGAAVGALWSLGASDGEQVRRTLKRFADPDQLGDFLTGLFALAREQVQRQRDLVLSINETVNGYGDEKFLAALPSLRLAFTYFTPREKHYLALTLREGLGLKEEEPLAALEVSVETAARALAFEGSLFAALEKYGIRGGKEEA